MVESVVSVQVTVVVIEVPVERLAAVGGISFAILLAVSERNAVVCQVLVAQVSALIRTIPDAGRFGSWSYNEEYCEEVLFGILNFNLLGTGTSPLHLITS